MARILTKRDDHEFHEAVPAAVGRSYRTQPVVETRDRAGKVVYVLTLAVEVLLGLRLLLRLLGASTVSSFVSTIYTLSEPLIRPFFGIFSTTIDDQIAGFELGTLFAMLVYGIVGYLIIAGIRAARGRNV